MVSACDITLREEGALPESTTGRSTDNTSPSTNVGNTTPPTTTTAVLVVSVPRRPRPPHNGRDTHKETEGLGKCGEPLEAVHAYTGFKKAANFGLVRCARGSGSGPIFLSASAGPYRDQVNPGSGGHVPP
jgi:hypothetical protein